MIEFFDPSHLENFEPRQATPGKDWKQSILQQYHDGSSKICTLRRRGEVAGVLGFYPLGLNHMLFWSVLSTKFDMWTARLYRELIAEYPYYAPNILVYVMEVEPGYVAGESLAKFLGFRHLGGSFWVRGNS